MTFRGSPVFEVDPVSGDPLTQDGLLGISVRYPSLPFGSIHAEKLTPIFQTDAVYGINDQQVLTTVSGSGSSTASDSLFVCQTGSTIYSVATIQSRKRLRYRAGQGVVCRFTGLFTNPVASSYQVIGCGHPEDGYFFGYQNTSFGILKSSRGVREVQTLTVSTASTTTENITVKLSGVDFSVAVTNSASTVKTAYEISLGTYTGWKAEQVGSTVIFVADAVGNKAAAFSVTGTTVVASFAETRAGSATTDTFVDQSSWNGDKLDGTGGSGVTLDPTKLNAFQIDIQYLGAGNVFFKVLVSSNKSDLTSWVIVHTIRNTNSLTTTHVSNPSFPFTMAAYSAGSTTNLSVKSGSFSGFVEGEKKLHGVRLTYVNSLTTVGSTNYQAIFTLRNSRVFAGKTNQSVINIVAVMGALKHTSPCIFYLIKNGTLSGTPNFTQHAATSCSAVDTAATTVTFSTNDQLLWTGHLGDTGEIDHHFNGSSNEELTLQPGETVTLAARAVTGTPSYVTGSLNTREDQ